MAMDIKYLKRFKDWFEEFTDGYLHPAGPKDRENLALKVKHTLDVCENIIGIAKGESLQENDVRLAEAVALLHDVGRFPQYAKWRSYRDSVSENHGELGFRVIKDAGILNALPPAEREIILQAVKYHNAYSMPHIGGKALIMLKLLRDADKLDIWRLFLESGGNRFRDEETSGIFLGLSDTPGYSEDFLSAIFDGKQPPLGRAKNINDFRLLLLSWIYDLNFGASFRLLLERGYIDKIAEQLPRTKKIKKLAVAIKKFSVARSHSILKRKHV